MDAMIKGTRRNVESDTDTKKPGGRGADVTRISDDETFTRLFCYGTVHLNRGEEETWLTPLGLLLDLWECHKQYLGLSKPKREVFIDEIIPDGI